MPVGKKRARFNSKLVRLKDGTVYRTLKSETGFNSKLVRLKASRCGFHDPRDFSVSIPNWCD